MAWLGPSAAATCSMLAQSNVAVPVSASHRAAACCIQLRSRSGVHACLRFSLDLSVAAAAGLARRWRGAAVCLDIRWLAVVVRDYLRRCTLCLDAVIGGNRRWCFFVELRFWSTPRRALAGGRRIDFGASLRRLFATGKEDVGQRRFCWLRMRRLGFPSATRRVGCNRVRTSLPMLWSGPWSASWTVMSLDAPWVTNSKMSTADTLRC